MSDAPTKAADERNYRKTLNLPKTSFPMKANLIQNEPASLKRWSRLGGKGLYESLREREHPRGRFVFHDGPPYANGSIHLGHLMNKCLKDFVVRSRSMMGYDVPYVPGWDCHGLPIEHKVMTELVESGEIKKLEGLDDDARRSAVRKACQKYATRFVKLQTGQMQRLLTLADYDNPYLTMIPAYEGSVLDVLSGLLERGLVFRALKPVHWSVANETALAEAELEYMDREDLSVYVDFEGADADAIYSAFGVHEGDRPGQTPSFMIWTTTPWTLPANLAIAVHERFEYALVIVDGNVTVLAKELVEKVTKAGKSEEVTVLATAPGARLVGLRYKHPRYDLGDENGTMTTGPFTLDLSNPESVRNALASGTYTQTDDGGYEPDLSKKENMLTIVGADYVSLEDGTGLVHTAPGHGADDYNTGLRYGLPIYCPVRHDGTYDRSVPRQWQGKSIFDANEEIAKRLEQLGNLYYMHTFSHSYPHDWRSKTPVIFRCTEQWFVGVGETHKFVHPDDPKGLPRLSLRERALNAVSFDPRNPITDVQRELVEHSNPAYDQHVADSLPVTTPRELPREKVEEIATRWGPEAALQSRDQIRFVPAWGRNRMRGMLETRPDWCISRQRAWGLPIPSFEMPDASSFMTSASAKAVAQLFREKGSDAWFRMTPEELLTHYDASSDPDAPAGLDLGSLKKGADILDVWFESGSSWNAVMRQRFGDDAFPVELYLEGSDQHRGWFQLSMLPALGVMGTPPYKALLTHGFCNDKDGKKLSKSAGHTIESLFERYGADVLRWWVCSLSYENDVKVDDEFFRLAGDSYRKVRNTLRFMLSNLGDFDERDGDDAPGAPGASIDAWVLGELDRVRSEVVAALERYDFRAAHNAIYDFCNETLSAVYLAAVKDRLYCDAPDTPRRRRTQRTLFTLTDGLCRLLAPALCHTADEAYRALRKIDPKDTSVSIHTLEFLAPTGAAPDAAWGDALKARHAAMIALEASKKPTDEGGLGLENPLDAGLTLPDPTGALARLDPDDLTDLCAVSRVSLDPNASEPVVVDLRDQPRCERSWKRTPDVRERSDGGMLSDRDAQAVGVA